MNRDAFLAAVAARLKGLPPADVQRSLDYFREMIDDRMEDGLSEEAAVAALGSPEEAAGRILEETPLPRLVKARIKPSRTLRLWEIVLLALGSPVWLPLVLVGLLLALLVYLLLVLFLLVYYTLNLAVGAVCLAGLWQGAAQLFLSRPLPALMCLGTGLTAAGLFMLMLPLAKQATVWDLALWRLTGRRIKRIFIKKGEAA